jgi:hypothetical protein
MPEHLQLIMPAPRQRTMKPSPRWIKALSSTDAVARENAGRHLLAAGNAALPALDKRPNGLTAPWLRQTLRSVITAITCADALRGPVVTLKLNRATLREVINRLCLPVGIHPEFYPLFASGAPVPAYFDHQRLSVDVQRQPFWAVLQRLAQRTGVSPGPGFFDQVLHFGDDRFGIFLKNNPIDIHGAFLFALECPGKRWGEKPIAPALPAVFPQPKPIFTRHIGQRFVEPDVRPGTQLIQLELDMLWCPDGNRISYVGGLQHLHVVDSAGNIMALSKNSYGQQFNAWNQNRQVEFNYYISLERPPAEVKKIAIIRGNVPIAMSFSPLTQRINNLSSGRATLYTDGLYFKFGKPAIDPASRTIPPGPVVWKVPLTIGADTVGAHEQKVLAGIMQSIQSNGAHALLFKCENGKRWRPPPIFSRSGLGPCYHYVFKVYGSVPVAAQVTTYRQRSVKMNVSFEFKDVPVPRK